MDACARVPRRALTDLRRPLWFDRPLRPTEAAYRVPSTPVANEPS